MTAYLPENKLSNIGPTAMASNNLSADNQDQNNFDSKKRIKADTLESLETKLWTPVTQ